MANEIDIDVSDLTTERTFTAAEVEAIASKRVSADRARAGAGPVDRLGRVEAAIERLSNVLAPKPAAPVPVAAAAPAAPSGAVNPITSGGLVDLWNLSEAQLQSLVESGQLRPAFERIMEVGERRGGAPSRPDLKLRKGGR